MESACFPHGLRVLVVDADTNGSKKLENMLIKCNYEVTICNSAPMALDMLGKSKDGFDIVISDANVSGMFLEQVGIDLPVVMMCVDGERSRVMKGVQQGACDYLLKPVKLNELRKIWQHVYRKRVHKERERGGGIGIGVEEKENLDQILVSGDKSDDSYSFSGDMVTGKKRKDYVDVDDNQILDSASASASASAPSLKKHRVVWSSDLHEKFVNAVNRMGLDKVGPKKILDLMGVPWLTRENVASHLQKYRIYKLREQKENEIRVACGGGVKLSNFSENNYLESGVTSSSLTLQQNIVINENYVSPGHELHIHNHSTSAHIREGNVSGILSMPMLSKALYGDVVDVPISSSSRIAFNQQQPKFESNIQAHHTWSGGRVADHQPMDFYSKNISYAFGHENTATIPQQSYLPHYCTFEPASCSTWNTKSRHNVEQQSHIPYNNMVLVTGSTLTLHDMEQNDCTPATESFECSNPEKLDEMLNMLNPQNFEDDQNFEDEDGIRWNDME